MPVSSSRLAALALALLLAPPLATTPAAAQQLIAAYTAYLSPQDHFNSSGERLTRAAAIIRQDRANFQQFGRADRGDEWDPVFHDRQNRAVLERWLAAGEISPADERRIVNGDAWVTVEVWGTGKSGQSIRVFVSR